MTAVDGLDVAADAIRARYKEITTVALEYQSVLETNAKDQDRTDR